MPMNGDIPAFTISGVLPPFTAESPTDQAAMSPYRTNLVKLADRYGTSPRRLQILLGLITYRSELMRIGIQSGFQWLDGSFLENVERTEGRDPGDIDVVTFFRRPDTANTLEALTELASANITLFDSSQSKVKYSCDAYFVDLSEEPEWVVSQTRYWFGLFSHKRVSFLWKGMLEIPLGDSQDEHDALKLVESRVNQ
jgi:hypothetical protein